jgi:hypothetical protein
MFCVLSCGRDGAPAREQPPREPTRQPTQRPPEEEALILNAALEKVERDLADMRDRGAPAEAIEAQERKIGALRETLARRRAAANWPTIEPRRAMRTTPDASP